MSNYFVLALCLSIYAINGMGGQGIDILPNMIKRAYQHNNLSLEVLDISEVQYPFSGVGGGGFHKEYNLITVSPSLLWVKDQKQVLKDIAILLAHKGKIEADLAHKDCPYLCARIAMYTHDKWKQFFKDYKVPYYPSDVQEVEDWLNAVGLKKELVTKIEASHTFAKKEEFINFMRAIPIQIDRIPQERHEEFFNDIINEYLKEVPQKEDGSIELRVSAIAVRAERAAIVKL